MQQNFTHNKKKTLPVAGKSCGFIDDPEGWFRVCRIAEEYTKKPQKKVI